MKVSFLIGLFVIIRDCRAAPINAVHSSNRKNFIPNRFDIKGVRFQHGKPNYIQVIPGTGEPGNPPRIIANGQQQLQPGASPGTRCMGSNPCNPYGGPPPYPQTPNPYGQYPNPVAQPDPYGYQPPVQYPFSLPPPPVQYPAQPPPAVQYPAQPPSPVQYPQPQAPCTVGSFPC